MEDSSRAKRIRLQELIHRKDKVLAVTHPPTAAHGRIMEWCGIEAGFVGTSGVVGTYTGLSDVGTATMTECLQVGQWIAQSVSYPIILDGDTGHGGVMAVRRLIHECIKAGIAVAPYFALAAGFLTGKYRSEADLGKSVRGARSAAKYLTPKGHAVLAALDQVAAETKCTPGQAAIAWLLAKPGVTAILASATSLEQLADLVRAAQVSLSAAQVAALDEASK